jgi:hemerythrin
MSTAFAWKDSYSVKVMAMDNQHKKLFDLINEFSEAMHSGRGKDVVGDVLLRLIDYTAHHFSAEEKLMERLKYGGLATHRGEHKYLTEKVQTFKKEFDAGNTNITPELLTFLQKWLTNHIQVVDQKYGDFMNAHGVH